MKNRLTLPTPKRWHIFYCRVFFLRVSFPYVRAFIGWYSYYLPFFFLRLDSSFDAFYSFIQFENLFVTSRCWPDFLVAYFYGELTPFTFVFIRHKRVISRKLFAITVIADRSFQRRTYVCTIKQTLDAGFMSRLSDVLVSSCLPSGHLFLTYKLVCFRKRCRITRRNRQREFNAVQSEQIGYGRLFMHSEKFSAADHE